MSTDIIIVDAKDDALGLKAPGTLIYQDIYRVSALWLTDTKTGDTLLAQRKWTEINDPGKWTGAVCGTVEAGESYEANIIKEVEEEIGLVGLTLKRGPKLYIDDGKHKYFCQWFFAEIDKSKATITIQEEEVEAIQWISKAKLLADVASNPDKYAPSTSETLKALGVSA